MAALTTWEWRPSLLLVSLGFGVLFLRGWVHLRGHSRHGHLVTWKALVLYGLGLALLLYALQSFLDVYGGLLLTIHMVQHLLLLMVVPCLLLWANPFPIMLWSLPTAWRIGVTRHLQGGAAFRQGLGKVTPMPVLYGLYIGSILLWHDPGLYNQAQNNNWIHDLEHITFFGCAMLFWWPIFAAGPRIHGHVGHLGKMAALLLCVPPHVILGGLLSFVDYPVYSHFETVPRIFGMSVMQDQKMAGIIMWIPASMMYLVGVIVLLGQLVSHGPAQRSDRSPGNPE